MKWSAKYFVLTFFLFLLLLLQRKAAMNLFDMMTSCDLLMQQAAADGWNKDIRHKVKCFCKEKKKKDYSNFS